MSKTVNDTISQRAATHGNFEDTALTAQLIKYQFQKHPDYLHLPTVVREGFDMIASKLARICNGNPFEVDHYHDIAGYATLIENYLRKEQAKPSTSKEK